MLIDNIVKILGGILTVLALLVGGLYAGYKTAPPADLSLGAIPGNEVQGKVLRVGGLDLGFFSQPVVGTSSVLCAFQNPFNATSSIKEASLQTTSSLLGANQFDISTSTTQYGSSSPALIAAGQIGSGLTGSFVWNALNATTTTGLNSRGAKVLASIPFGDITGESNYILGPVEWITVRLSTSTAGLSGSFASPYRGTCGFELRKL